MKEETGYFSSFDGTRLFYRAWEKDSPNALVIIHGIGEHSGRYVEFINTLDALPISVFVLEMRGHGHSEGNKVYVDTFADFVEDVSRFRSFVLDKRSGKERSLILLGQSLGGLIATHTVLRSQKDWRGLILLSPFFGLPFCNVAGIGLASALNLLGAKHLWVNPMQPAFLTHDKEELNIYKQDPLIQRRITGSLAREMFKAASGAMNQADKITIPLLVLASGNDYIVSTTRTKRFFNKVSSKEKTINVFKGFYHELLHEIDRDKPIAVLKEYLSHLV